MISDKPISLRVTRCARPIHTLQSVGDRDQPGADATVALPPRPTAQLLRTNVIAESTKQTLWVPSSPNHNICYS